MAKRTAAAKTAAAGTPASSTAHAILVQANTTSADPRPTPDSNGEAVSIPVSRTAKTIQPLGSSLPAAESASVTPGTAPETTAASSESASEPTATQKAVPKPAQPAPEAAAAETDDVAEMVDRPAETEAAAQPAETVTEEPSGATETDATETAKLAAEEKRQADLERLITDGTYFVPINAVQRKRSRFIVIALLITAVVLAIAAVDLLADAGTIGLPRAIPRTHFFSS